MEHPSESRAAIAACPSCHGVARPRVVTVGHHRRTIHFVCECCGHEWDVDGIDFRCAACGAADAPVVSGEEFLVESIDVEEQEPACTA